MNGAYILLIATILVALFNRDKRIIYPLIVVTNLAGLYCGIINIVALYGLLSLA